MARILIVDDDSSLVQILTLALKSFGHEVSSASDSALGLQEARKFKPELILLDYHLPGATGAHLFEAFRRNTATTGTPILFMSGDANSEHIFAEIAETRGVRFLAKPVRLEELRQLLEEMLFSKDRP